MEIAIVRPTGNAECGGLAAKKRAEFFRNAERSEI
jgi:hypothetical protein